MDDRTRLIRDVTRRPGPCGRRPVNPAVARGTTLLNPRAADLRDDNLGPTYGISGLDAQAALAAALAELEGAERVFLLPTGLAAVTAAVLAVAQAGDEVLATDALYGPSRKFLTRFMGRFGVAVRWFRPTWAAGLLFKPLAHGVTLSVQALSKYVGGHSDVFGGSVAIRDPEAIRRVETVIDDLGWYMSPDDAWLALRGLRTLAVRMPAHAAGALAVADWLQGRPEVLGVLHPTLPASPDHALWRRDFTGANGLLGVVLRPGPAEAAHAFLDALQLFGIGFSWGGFESLATWDDPQLRQRRHHAPLGGPLVRLHIGLEAPADLIADLGRGLDVYARLTENVGP